MDVRPRYDEKLVRILRASATVIAEKGYHRASIRDIAAATGVSLSGLYYYFSSKEELLFLIQRHCFETILQRLEEDLEGITDPAERLDRLVRSHLRFFVANMSEMKVLSHEADSLDGDYLNVVKGLKRSYADRTREILEELAPSADIDARTASLLLFGAMNWIYTWYRPGRDLDVDDLADHVLHLFLEGFLAPPPAIAARVPGAGHAPSIWREP